VRYIDFSILHPLATWFMHCGGISSLAPHYTKPCTTGAMLADNIKTDTQQDEIGFGER
jgi:hypothetical protein